MDRQYFLHRHDEELARARDAASDNARVAHEALAMAFKEAAEGLNSPNETTTGDCPATP